MLVKDFLTAIVGGRLRSYWVLSFTHFHPFFFPPFEAAACQLQKEMPLDLDVSVLGGMMTVDCIRERI